MACKLINGDVPETIGDAARNHQFRPEREDQGRCVKAFTNAKSAVIAGKNEKAREFVGDVFANVIATIGWLRAAWRSSGIESCSALFKAWVRSKFTQGGAPSR